MDGGQADYPSVDDVMAGREAARAGDLIDLKDWWPKGMSLRDWFAGQIAPAFATADVDFETYGKAVYNLAQALVDESARRDREDAEAAQAKTERETGHLSP